MEAFILQIVSENQALYELVHAWIQFQLDNFYKNTCHMIYKYSGKMVQRFR